jgi:hypothetical protein
MLGMVLNDHWLKSAALLPAWLTGKLSDFLGLFFFPIMFAAILGLLLPRASARWLLAVSSVLTVLVFAAIKLDAQATMMWTQLSAWAGAWVPGKAASVTRDPTDLVAVPMVFLAWWWTLRPRKLDLMKADSAEAAN